MQKSQLQCQGRIRLVSIPDGLDPADDRTDVLKVTESILKNMPGHFKDLIEKINQSNDDEQISCTLLMQPLDGH